MNLIALLQQWAGTASWQTMNPMVRGFYAQIVLMSAQQEPIGWVPSSEKTLRKWLSIPPAPPRIQQDPLYVKAASEADGTSMIHHEICHAIAHLPTIDSIPTSNAEEPESAQHWFEILWAFQWKKALLQTFTPINASFIQENPQFKGKQGWAIPFLIHGAFSLQPVLHPSPVAAPKKQRTPRMKNTLLTPEIPVFLFGDLTIQGCAFLDYDVPKQRDIVSVQRWWTQAIPNKDRPDIWRLGISILATDHSESKHARSYLAKMIMQFGEAAVARAVADMSTRTVPPVERYSYFTSLLKTYQLGSKAEQKARAQRATVAL